MHLVPIIETGALAEYPAELAATISAVLQATTQMYCRKGYEPPWIGYLAIENGACVGTCGFNGPQRSNEVEIAYFTFPGNEGMGVATRMASALLAIAQKARPDPPSVLAHTLPEENASTSILRKLGFSLEGEVIHPEDGNIWQWRFIENVEA